jgi:U3 small nucleolar RNA-associated protein 23
VIYPAWSLTFAQAEEKALHVPASDRPLLKSAAPQPQETVRKKRIGPKGPNPLSVKKKKMQITTKPEQPQVLAKRKRDANDEDNQQTPSSQHRKRRRKAHQSNTESTSIQT